MDIKEIERRLSSPRANDRLVKIVAPTIWGTDCLTKDIYENSIGILAKLERTNVKILGKKFAYWFPIEDIKFVQPCQQQLNLFN